MKFGHGSETPLSIFELNEKFPWMLRSLSQVMLVGNEIWCIPQVGEHTRFGVYFYALAVPIEERQLDPKRSYILAPTADLQYGVDASLLQKGVLVFPSQAYFQEIERLGARQDRDGFDVDSEINHQWVVLDMAAEQRDKHPILSIPSQVHMSFSRLVGNTCFELREKKK